MANCNNDCLNCTLEKCLLDIEDLKEIVADAVKRTDRERHKKYYLEHKEEIDRKQREVKREVRAERSRRFYKAHKGEINEKNHLRYLQNRDERKKQALEHYYANREEINKRRRERYRLKKGSETNDKHGESESFNRQHEELELGC